jgi:hypothetical protein
MAEGINIMGGGNKYQRFFVHAEPPEKFKTPGQWFIVRNNRELDKPSGLLAAHNLRGIYRALKNFTAKHAATRSIKRAKGAQRKEARKEPEPLFKPLIVPLDKQPQGAYLCSMEAQNSG